MVNIGVSCVAITWIIAEIVGKFLLTKLDKKVIAIIAGVATAIGAKLVAGVGSVDTVALGIGLPVVAGILHDKVVNPLLMKGK